VKLTAANARAAIEAVAQVLDIAGAADRALSAFFRSHRALGRDDRGLVADTVYAVLRHRRTLERTTSGRRLADLAAAALVGPLGRNAREAAQALERPAEEMEALRARWHAVREQASGAEAVDLPDWIWTRLVEQYGEAEARALARSLLQPAPLDLRVNAAQARRDEVLERLAAGGLRAVATPFAPFGIRLADKPSLQEHPAFREGLVEVQDEASQLVCHLLGPRRGEMIVDFCAGAGGKTLAIAALMRNSGRVYAFDVSAARLAKFKPRLARSGASNVHPQLISGERDVRVKRLFGKIDRVLIDAPCSGLGTLRRNPELKWRQQPSDVEAMVQKQTAILEGAHRLLKAGGRLVYVTCSLLREENEQVVERFLREHPEFRMEDASSLLAAQQIELPMSASEYLRTSPHVHHTDGFFAASLLRVQTP
jgi:16S rRNA (cytosine967-C5)-methyltransferase